MRKQFLFLLILVYLFSGCRKNPVLLEEVLAYSGANRPELEKVIAHYARNPEDSLKLRAAVFLIENMPGHYGRAGIRGLLGEIGYDTGSALPCEKDDADRPLSLSELQETDAGL